MNVYIGVDPGPEEHGVVWYDSTAKRVIRSENSITTHLVPLLFDFDGIVAIEWIESYGMAVGKSVFETCLEIGRLVDAPKQLRLIPRRLVKLHLCGTMRAKDPNIRQALIDKLGGKGTKKSPGPLHGISEHLWSALAIAVYAAECSESEPEYKPRR